MRWGGIGGKEEEGGLPMTTSMRCPNRSCGRVSQLVDDPLGRIFRCPRCLTKLPTAPASAADSGWTAVMRPSLHPGSGSRGQRARRARTRGGANLVGVADPDGDSSGWEDGGMRIGGFDFDGESQYGAESDPGLDFDESSGVFIEPISHPGSRVSAWSTASRALP